MAYVYSKVADKFTQSEISTHLFNNLFKSRAYYMRDRRPFALCNDTRPTHTIYYICSVYLTTVQTVRISQSPPNP